METRPLGTTGADVTEVGLGTWEIGSDWGDVAETRAREAVRPRSTSGSRSLTPRTCTATAGRACGDRATGRSRRPQLNSTDRVSDSSDRLWSGSPGNHATNRFAGSW